MNLDRKKALKSAYKSRQVTGGVYRITCGGNGRCWIQATRDMASLKNRFNFALATKGCPDPAMRDEWVKYGAQSFSLDVLEELKKGEDQTDAEFADDIDVLCRMWLEKSRQIEA